MNKLESSKEKIETLKKLNHTFNFPNFVRELRLALGVTRKVMSQDLKMCYIKLYYIENGSGTYIIEDRFIEKIANYFGIPFSVMKAKAEKYYPRNRKEGEPCNS